MFLNSYWEYAGTRYKHKFKAIEASRGDVHNITFNTLDSSYENYDWTKEPAESFEDLMRERAFMLRDTYPYVKLWFSGGSDSTTVLRVFLENNIHIDEICVYRYLTEGNSSNQEINNFTLPYLKSIQSLLPNTKIKTFLWGHDYYQKYLSEEWLQTKNQFTPRHFHIPNIRGSNYCNIFCGQEPTFEKKDGKYYLTFWDTDHYGELSGYRNIELFYTTPSFLKLHAKQAHIVINYLKENNLEVPEGVEYKNLMRKLIRDTAIAPETKAFITNKTPYGVKQWIVPKDKALLADMDSIALDKFRYILSTRVNNTPIINLYKGYSTNTFYMGE